MVQKRSVSWGGVLGVLLAAGVAGGGAMWAASLQQLERSISRKRSALKPLQLAGRIPPNRDVHDYLAERTASLKATYQAALKRLASEEAAVDGRANPQLFFQERVHEMQRTLERLAGARAINPPEQLGLPKELPPPDVVPRLLVQLDLIEDASDLILSQSGARLLSVKLEDPEVLPPPSEEQPEFLMRLPVRFHVECSLSALTKILGMVERAKPFMDVQGISTRQLGAVVEETAAGENDQPTGPSPAQALDVEIILARYLATAPDLPPVGEEADVEKGARPAKKSAGARRTTPSED